MEWEENEVDRESLLQKVLVDLRNSTQVSVAAVLVKLDSVPEDSVVEVVMEEGATAWKILVNMAMEGEEVVITVTIPTKTKSDPKCCPS